MPSLLEILKDPNYTNANQATKQAIFDKYSAQDENYAGANDATKQAIRARFGLTPPPAAPTSEPAPTEERGVLGYLGDVGAAFGAGAGQAVAAPGQLYRTFISKETEPGAIEQLGKRAAEYWEEKKSATQRAKERAVEQKVEAAEQAGAGILGQLALRLAK
jgi:hypothetical protein